MPLHVVATVRVVIQPTRIFHVNVNCRDLTRSLAFYRDLVGLQPRVHTAPESPQPGGAFGLEQVQWDAWMLGGDDGGVLLDLLEWRVPGPEGAPPPPGTPGFARLRVVTAATVEQDPDGTAIDVVRGERPALSGVVVHCTDLDRSRHHYGDICGLTRSGDVFRDPASGFEVQLLAASSGPVAPRQANQLGIFRMAWSTDDVDRDHEALLADGVVPLSPPVTMAMGPGLPAVRVLFWRDPDGACLELIETPR